MKNGTALLEQMLHFPWYFQQYSKLNLNYSWIFSMLSKNRKKISWSKNNLWNKGLNILPKHNLTELSKDPFPKIDFLIVAKSSKIEARLVLDCLVSSSCWTLSIPAVAEVKAPANFFTPWTILSLFCCMRSWDVTLSLRFSYQLSY